jgi:hypothetical protein
MPDDKADREPDADQIPRLTQRTLAFLRDTTWAGVIGFWTAFGGVYAILSAAVTSGVSVPYNGSLSEFVILVTFGLAAAGCAMVYESRRAAVKELPSGFAFISECGRIVRQNSEILILAKTPVILLQRDQEQAGRLAYFHLIEKRVESSPGNVQIRYMFDIDGFLKQVLRDVAEGRKDRVEWTRNAIERFRDHHSLKLRWVKSGKLTSVVIADSKTACIALRRDQIRPIVYGLRLRNAELVRVLQWQYDNLWNDEAQAVTQNFWTEVVEKAIGGPIQSGG